MSLHTNVTREGTEWAITYWYNANDSRLPRILMIGDSICNGYQGDVRDQLAGIAYVSFHATSKSASDPSFLKEITYVLSEYDYAVVLFNNGLHSLDEVPEDWASYLVSVCDLILEKLPDAVILWINSTPLKDSGRTAKVQQLNEAAKEVLKNYHTSIDAIDLFALMDPLDRANNWRDTYHFHSDAIQQQATAVSNAIKATLGRIQVSEAEARSALERASSETGPDGSIAR